jgi:methyl-accepting chemotaxis protein/hemerythrin
MALVTWTPKMSVGVVKIDEEHQGLFDVMNQLHEGMLQGRGGDVLGPAMAKLAQYTRVHFGDEEYLLRRHGYPKLLEHMQLHEAFREKFRCLEAQFKTGTAAVAVGTVDFLREWLSKHILVVDAQYKAFLASKGVK